MGGVGCPIFIFCKKIRRKKTDADTMCGDSFLTVTQKACVPHFQILL